MKKLNELIPTKLDIDIKEERANELPFIGYLRGSCFRILFTLMLAFTMLISMLLPYWIMYINIAYFAVSLGIVIYLRFDILIIKNSIM